MGKVNQYPNILVNFVTEVMIFSISEAFCKTIVIRNNKAKFISNNIPDLYKLHFASINLMKKIAQKKAYCLNSFASDMPFVDITYIRKKLPTWGNAEGLTFPNRLCLEQCSGERTALYKSNLVKRLFPNGAKCMADLTGGLGIDFSFMVRNFERGLYIERQEVLCEAAKNNFPKIGLKNIEIINGDGTDQLINLPEMDLIFMDPARRDQVGKKTVLIEDCEPNVLELLPLLWKKTNSVMLKLSPMLDLTRAIKSLQNVKEAHIVADGGECKELLLVLQPNVSETKIICSDLNQTFSFFPREEIAATVQYTSSVHKYLYEPNSAILKAGAFKLLAKRLDLEKLHPNSHLYTSDKWIKDFPGRSFEVQMVSSFNKKELKNLCNSVEKANLTVRNFPGSVAELRKRLKLKEGGDAYWFATTLSNEKHVIIDCRKVNLE